jgi:hypothetical protein
MIENIITQIITELGPVGLLIIGLYFVLMKPLTAISKHLEVINRETGEVRDALLAIKTILELKS